MLHRLAALAVYACLATASYASIVVSQEGADTPPQSIVRIDPPPKVNFPENHRFDYDKMLTTMAFGSGVGSPYAREWWSRAPPVMPGPPIFFEAPRFFGQSSTTANLPPPNRSRLLRAPTTPAEQIARSRLMVQQRHQEPLPSRLAEPRLTERERLFDRPLMDRHR